MINAQQEVLTALERAEIKPEDYRVIAMPIAGGEKYFGRLVRLAEPAHMSRSGDPALITVMSDPTLYNTPEGAKQGMQRLMRLIIQRYKRYKAGEN